MLRNIAELGFSEPTPIQRQAIPVLLSVCLLEIYKLSIYICEGCVVYFSNAWHSGLLYFLRHQNLEKSRVEELTPV